MVHGVNIYHQPKRPQKNEDKIVLYNERRNMTMKNNINQYVYNRREKEFL